MFFFYAPSAFLLVVFFVYTLTVKAGENELLISEIMYDPKGTDAGHSDWIEIYNDSDAKITLRKSSFGIIDESELVIGKDKLHYLNCHEIKNDISIEPGDYVILADNADNFLSDYREVVKEKIVDTTFNLSSNGDSVYLSNDKCATFFIQLSYENSWGAKNNGKTLELIDVSEGYAKNNWQQSWQMGGTPGAKKSEKKNYDQKIYLNEICPKPAGGEKEFVELYNAKDKDEDLDQWKIIDRAGKECLFNGEKINASDYLIVYNNPDKNCNLALNDTSGEELNLLNPNGEIVSKIDAYTSAKAGLAYAFDGKKWRWTKFLTPGKENIFNNLPQEKKTKIPKEAYANVYADFYVKTSDRDGDKIKVKWEFGDGHYGYKAETRHKYTKEGRYNGSLKISDGSEDVIKEFTIKVEDYPERKVRIIAVNANPVGKDTEGESITVENKSKKKINLNGWSVATGSKVKKLSNHPINDDLEIKAGKTGEITRDICALTLNNTKGYVELRYPDGEVADDVKYKKPDKAGVKEGEIYEKVGKKWSWHTTAQDTRNKVQDINNKQETIRQLADNNQTEEENSVQNKVGGILPEDAGKKSEIEVKNKLEENSYLENKIFAGAPAVLGIETVRVANSSYQFTPEITLEEHYAITFFRKITITINASFNKAINFRYK